MPIGRWQEVLDDLAHWAGGCCKLQISGGEPLIYEHIFRMLNSAVRGNLMPGICTNGTLVNGELARRLMDLGLANVNVSVEGVGIANDRSRGMGTFQRIDRGIRTLVRERESTGARTLIVLKTVLMGANAQGVPNLLKYARNVGVDGILFQPLADPDFSWTNDKWYKDSKLFSADGSVMEEAIASILEARSQDRLVLNPVEHILLFKDYFKNPAALANGPGLCNVGHTTLFIDTAGAMTFCPISGDIGNAREVLPSIAWTSESAEAARRRVNQCRRTCLLTCWTHKSLAHKARAFIRLVKGTQYGTTQVGE